MHNSGMDTTSVYACTQLVFQNFLQLRFWFSNRFDGSQIALPFLESCLAFSNHVPGSPITFAFLKLYLPFMNHIPNYPITFAVCDRI